MCRIGMKIENQKSWLCFSPSLVNWFLTNKPQFNPNLALLLVLIHRVYGLCFICELFVRGSRGFYKYLHCCIEQYVVSE